MLKALTVWQPWASLIAEGAKPHEWRGWDYSHRPNLRAIVGTRIAIHAGARPMVLQEIADVMARIRDGTSMLEAPAEELIARLLLKTRAEIAHAWPLSSIVATAVVGKPIPALEALAPLIRKGAIDSDRVEHGKWAWPLTDVIRVQPPIPYRGAQGFWTVKGSTASAVLNARAEG